jgi:hypothetical protein
LDQATAARRTVMIRDLDTDIWGVVRGEAARRGWNTAAVLEHIVREWQASRNRAQVEVA